MKVDFLLAAARLSGAELLARLKELVRRETESTAELIAHIAELDRRGLFLREGMPSLFAYCTRVLHLSEYATYSRIQAARVSRRLPLVLDRLADGSVNLTAVGLLGPHLTPENHVDLLNEARFRTKREVEEIVARLRPLNDVPEYVRKLPVATPPRTVANTTAHVAGNAVPHSPGMGATGVARSNEMTSPDRHSAPEAGLLASRAGASGTNGCHPRSEPTHPVSGINEAGVEGPPPLPPLRRPTVIPIAPERYKIQFTAGAGTYQKLCRAQDLLRHQLPDGNPSVVIDRALTVLVTELERRRFAAVSKPVTGRFILPTEGASAGAGFRWQRFVPAEVRRIVWRRDGGRCAFVTSEGERCPERGWLEFHHVRPYAHGGPPVADNIELRCRAHNQYEAELIFGSRTE